jgi:hypothetical protein
MALPEPITAATKASRSRRVDRARRGTWTFSPENVLRGQIPIAENLRLAQTTSTGGFRECTRECSRQVEYGGSSIGARGSRPWIKAPTYQPGWGWAGTPAALLRLGVVRPMCWRIPVAFVASGP